MHEGVAHIVNGISITSAYSKLYAFSRVDFELRSDDGERVSRTVHPPQRIVGTDTYEGVTLEPMPELVAIAGRAKALATGLKDSELGITLATPFTLDGNPESALGKLFTDALRDATGVDVALHNVAGGLRANLPAGPLTYGSVYEMFPFDNRIVVLSLSGDELRRIIANQAYRGSRRVGFSGITARVDCEDSRMTVELARTDGTVIADDNIVSVLVNDYLALGGDDILTPILPADGIQFDKTTALTRDIFLDWVSERSGRISASDFQSDAVTRWVGDFPIAADCQLAP